VFDCQFIMRIHLGGHLGWYDGEKRDWLTVEQPLPISLPDLAAALGVPAEEVAIIAVNRRLAHWDDPPVSDADVVEFFPPMGGGSMGGG
jgi:sulfur carrier protein ThiS